MKMQSDSQTNSGPAKPTPEATQAAQQIAGVYTAYNSAQKIAEIIDAEHRELRECLRDGIKLQDALASFADRQAWAARAEEILGGK